MPKKFLVSLSFCALLLVSVFFVYTKHRFLTSTLTLKTQNLSNSLNEVRETLVPIPTKIIDGLPNKYLIKTLFVPQSPQKNWQQPWQDACEEAGILTSVYYYNNTSQASPETIRHDLESILEFELSQGWGHDINHEKMAQIGRELFKLTAKVVTNPSLRDIKTYLSSGVPVIATANGKTLYRENKHFSNGGPYYHAVVILGYDDNTDKFIVHDVGTQYGAYYKYSQELLMLAIHDLPQSGKKEDIDSGTLSVVVLLK